MGVLQKENAEPHPIQHFIINVFLLAYDSS